MYLFDLTFLTTEQSGNDLNLYSVMWTFLTHRTRPQMMVDSSLNKVFLLYIALFTSTIISKVLTYLQIVLNEVLVKKGSRQVSQTILQFNVGGY